MEHRQGIRLAPPSRWAAAVLALLALGSLLLQYVLILRVTADTIGPAWATLRFFSYFTILSNIGVALVTGHAALARPGFFARHGVRAAVAVYIAITGAIYLLVLRHLWQPQGWQWWADSGLHYAVPWSYVGWWLLGLPHGGLRWRSLPLWLLFPAIYLLWVAVRGAWLHEYPYPFVDVGQLGGARVLGNAAGMLLLFVAAGAGLLGLDRWLGRRRSR
jgi:hypothetical protein